MATPTQRNRDIDQTRPGRNLLVRGGASGRPLLGLAWDNPFDHPQDAVNDAQPGDTIYVTPYGYEGPVVVPRSLENLRMKAAGGPGSVSIVATGANANGLTWHGRDGRLEGIGCAGTGTGAGLRVTGRRFSAADCKLEIDGYDPDAPTGSSLVLGPGLVAELGVSADKGDFGRFEACEFAYADKGVVLQGSDYGASGQHQFLGCRSIGLAAAHFAEAHLAGGAISLRYRDLLIRDHSFEFGTKDDGTVIDPTKFLDLAGDNANQGSVRRSTFPVAKASGKNAVSTALLGVANEFTDGAGTF